MERKLYFGIGQQPQNKQYHYPTNFITTSRYNILTFLPYSLALQFQRMANIYFLIIAILSFFKSISPFSPMNSIAPLLFVVCLSMLRDGYEDYQKHISDNELNSSPTTIWTSGGFVKKTWKDVIIGDIIKIDEMEIISADIVVLQTSQDGICFIETSSLDGEKNLKPKQAVKDTQTMECREGIIECINPNPLLYNFDGTLFLESKKIQLTHKNFLLRGSKLKNVKWAIGVVVYTGIDTKVMRNSEEQKNKMSNIDRLINVRIIYILIMQAFVCLILAIVYGINCDINSLNFQYFSTNFSGYESQLTQVEIYDPEIPNCALASLMTFAAYFLLLNTLIPISLIVSLEFVKVGQGIIMQKDKEMYTEENNKYVKVFSTTINEELGQVQYVFSDKTGTLTCNKMEFKISVCGNEIYGDVSMFDKHELNTFVENQILRRQSTLHQRRSTVVNEKAGIEYTFSGAVIQSIITETDPNKNPNIELQVDKYLIRNQGDLVKENLMLLATCHECVLELQDDGTFNYQGPSPDEIALVDAARRLNIIYKGIKMGMMEIDVLGVVEKIELLFSFEFNSDRKRMSVIVRHNGVIKLYTKGADAIIKERLAPNQPFLAGIDKKLDMFSRKGLRTLCLAMKVLDEQQFNQFSKAMNDTLGGNETEKQQTELINQMEKNLTLIGATAVEDKLQEDVPETLADFLKANINVWMLTGDKLETAENIGRSCNLLQEQMDIFFLTPGCDTLQIFNQIADHIIQQPNTKRAMIIEGIVLAALIDNENLTKYLVMLAPYLHTVICCRVTPKQKADMVRLVKNELGKITLAVGDGANDVNMIQEAHIGIGIYGQEGMRAVQASNYAIGQFKCLWKLILYHGRQNYIRISEMILYFFYKNIIFTIPQFYFAFFCGLTGTSVFDEFFVSFYNTIFTFLPVVIRAIFDEDVFYTQKTKQTIIGSKRITEGEQENDILRQSYPLLYYIGQKNTIFTSEKFFKWFSIGIFQGLACFFSFYFELNDTTFIKENGYNNDLWFFSMSMSTAIMILVTLKLALNTQFWTIITWIAYIITSLGTYFAYMAVSNIVPKSAIYGTTTMLFSSYAFYLSLALSVLSMFIFDLLMFTIKTSKDTLLNYMKRQAKQKQQLDKAKISKLEKKLQEQIQEMEMPHFELNQKISLINSSFSQNDSISKREPSKDNYL
ncbi:unnamed protein product [Paramecium sonneborni]|uniref:Phospholipid-transporting ATPase n=1 Tax=Paramecium sonneborni TaxID=65129 RepID=A0A8S1LQL2_9CILI|nr:unnamed protein product [Paramecium sonneborni]